MRTSSSAKPEAISPTSSIRVSTRSAIGCKLSTRPEYSSALRPPERGNEAQEAARQAHGTIISKTSVWRIIHSFGPTWKVLERRVIHIKELNVFRFMEELSHINWNHHNLVFLDEVSFDNRGLICKRGYVVREKKSPSATISRETLRVSILSCIGVNGIIDYFNTERTFDRLEFIKCCQDLVKKGPIRHYTGPNTIWIMD
ncbi:hypothetical protein PHMEG_00029640, partial [Phytophthora megakarya]